MKKLIFLVSLFGLFILASCDNEPTRVTTPSSNQTTEPNQQISNTNAIPSETTSEGNDNTTDKSSLPDYDDGTDWEGTIF